MGILDALFGRKKAGDSKTPLEGGGPYNESLGENAFLELPQVKLLAARTRRNTTLLRPNKAEDIPGPDESHMGGIANLSGHETAPRCPICHNHIKVALQIYRDDIAGMYFPEGKNLFQIFRCEADECEPEDYMVSDVGMLNLYTYVDSRKPGANAWQEDEAAKPHPDVNPCRFYPELAEDHPNSEDLYIGGSYSEMEALGGEDWTEIFDSKYPNHPNTKCGGWPSWVQYPNVPECTQCGKPKSFIFQLSSEDPPMNQSSDASEYIWSTHGIMLGDAGNMYFFICKDCGETTPETNWDCG